MAKCNIKYCNRKTDGKHKMCDEHRKWFREHARKTRANMSEEERQKRHRERYDKEKDRRREYARKQGESLRMTVLNHYGPVCVHCGHTDTDVLTIDHIDNNGNIHRKGLPVDGKAIYRWLIEHNFPAGFQVLCRNCNWKKHIKNLRRGNG
jgi:hypothetical protein